MSHTAIQRYGAEVTRSWPGVEILELPADDAPRLGEADLARIDHAYFSMDLVPLSSRTFFDAIAAAPNVKWLHVFNAGVDLPVFQRIMARGIRITTSSGSTAMPIAQSVIGGMLMLSRGFLHWRTAQQDKEWRGLTADQIPPDLTSQTMTVVGLGAIGAEIARIASAIGMHVIGVRRSPARPGDPVTELVTPAELLSVAPKTDWLVLACPLTEETRGLASREVFNALPAGAHLINIARGAVADEPALIEALQSGKLAGAYLDVFTKEPLPADSPFWEMPNVIVSPHNSAAARGNEGRASEYFLENVRRMVRGEALVNEVTA